MSNGETTSVMTTSEAMFTVFFDRMISGKTSKNKGKNRLVYNDKRQAQDDVWERVLITKSNKRKILIS